MRMDEFKGLRHRANAYTFKIWDTGGDDQPIRLSISYCDDNDGFHGGEDMDELKREVEKAIRMTGYFSIVTKLGRIGSKCVIYLYNPARAKEVESWTFSSYAWSFAAGTVIKEVTPVVVHFVKNPEIMKTLSEENKEAVRSLENKHEITKHLGVRYRTDRPDSTATGIAKCNQALARLAQINLRNIDDKVVAIIINSFIISFAQFEALESDGTITQLNKVDRAILNKVRKSFSLARNDMKEIIFLPCSKMGMGIRSFTGTTLATD
jgi:hypothetical protein